MTPGRRYDAILVGGGHNGLVAANYLARNGLRVVVFERRHVVGGACVTEEIFPGFRSNFAANTSANLDPTVVADLELGNYGLRFAHPEPGAFMMFPEGRRLIGWHDGERLREEIGQFSLRDRDRYFEVLQYMNALAEVLDVSFFDAPPTFAQLTSRLKTPAHEEAFAKLMFGSASEFLDEWLESEEVKASLAVVALSGNFTGPSTPGSAYQIVHRSLYRGSHATRDRTSFQTLGGSPTPMGGMGAITQAMARAAMAFGAEIRTETEVATIKCARGEALGVILASGEEIDAPIVISNLNPQKTLLDLIPAGEMPNEFRGRVANLDMRGTVSKVFIALDGLPQFGPQSSPSDDEMLSRCRFRTGPDIASMDRAYYQALAGHWSDVPVIWGFIPSAIDPSLTPPGKHLMSITAFHAPYHLAESNWDIERDKYAKNVIKVLGEYFPNFADIVLNYSALSPVDIEREFGMTQANIAHGDIKASRMFGLRPIAGYSDYTTPIRGLYLCGVGTWPANNVSGLPGRNASQKVLADLAAKSAHELPGRPDVDVAFEFGPS